MNTEELQRTITEYAVSQGACAVGYADLSGVAQARYLNMPVAVCLLVPHDRNAVAKLPEDDDFHSSIDIIQDRIISTETTIGKMLAEAGYESVIIKNDMLAESLPDMTAPLPMKMVATMAGLGWIGKSGILVTKGNGSAVRIAAVATDAPFATDQPVTESRCGNCMACVKACPTGAIRNVLWKQGMTRDDLLDIDRCYQYMIRDFDEIGRKRSCGLCMKLCAAG